MRITLRVLLIATASSGPIGETLLVWDLDEDEGFSDGLIPLDFEGEQVEIVHHKLDEISITWNTVDPARPLDWVGQGFRLAWREDVPGELAALRGQRLRLGHGVPVSHGAVKLLMRRAGPAGVTGRPRWRRSTPDQIATDLVDRQFSQSAPNQLWVTDITGHPTREGKVYRAVVLDASSRRVVGWSIDPSPTAALVTMIEAFWSRMQVELLDRQH
ncbi:DDE-type integrase/transposase/recombinase [Streptosporangium sp. G12]